MYARSELSYIRRLLADATDGSHGGELARDWKVGCRKEGA